VGSFDAGTHSERDRVLLSKLLATSSNNLIPPPLVWKQLRGWVGLFCSNSTSQVRALESSFTQGSTNFQGSISCYYRPTGQKIYFTIFDQVNGFIDLIFFNNLGLGPYTLTRLPGIDSTNSKTYPINAYLILIEQAWINLMCNQHLMEGIELNVQPVYSFLNSTLITCLRDSSSNAKIQIWFELVPPYWTLYLLGSGATSNGESNVPIVITQIPDAIAPIARAQAIYEVTMEQLNMAAILCHFEGGVAKVCDGNCYFS
jgi:hypothetical protein